MPASIGTYVDEQGRPRSWADDRLGERMRLATADLMRRGWSQDSSGQWVAPTTRVTGLPPLHSPSSYAQINQAFAANAPVPTGALPAPATTTSTTTAPAPFLNQSQAGQPAVGALPVAPAEIRTPLGQQPSPLMQMFNFPTLRTKKPAQATGAEPGVVGQYNENFWNAWRL